MYNNLNGDSNMIVHVRNFGKIESADIDLSNLTIFVGENNSGKSYLMQLIYGFLDFFNTSKEFFSEFMLKYDMITTNNDIIEIKADNAEFYSNLQTKYLTEHERLATILSKYPEYLEKLAELKKEENGFKVSFSENAVMNDLEEDVDNQISLLYNLLLPQAKYYSEEERCFNIKTKSGTFKMAPPKIGVMKAIIEYSREKEAKREKWDKSYMQIFSYINQDWRDLTDQVIFSKNVEFAGWSAIKFSTVLRLAEKMKVGVQKDMIQQCTNCSAEVAVPISFPGGIKSLFVISDIDSELL